MANACAGFADWSTALAALTDEKLLNPKDQLRLLRDMLMFEATVKVYGSGSLKKDAREAEVLQIYNTAVDALNLNERELPKGAGRADLKKMFRARADMTGASIVARANVRPRCSLRARRLAPMHAVCRR